MFFNKSCAEKKFIPFISMYLFLVFEVRIEREQSARYFKLGLQFRPATSQMDIEISDRIKHIRPAIELPVSVPPTCVQDTVASCPRGS